MSRFGVLRRTYQQTGWRGFPVYVLFPSLFLPGQHSFQGNSGPNQQLWKLLSHQVDPDLVPKCSVNVHLTKLKRDICHHFLPESRIWLKMTSPTEDGNACQPEFRYFLLSGVRRSPLGGFGIYVLFNLKCCDLCCNLFLVSLIFALLMDLSAGFRISVCAPAWTVFFLGR